MKVTMDKAAVCLECDREPCAMDDRKPCPLLDAGWLAKKRIREREWRRKKRAAEIAAPGGSQ